MEEDIKIPEIKMKRLRNLKMFKGKTDEDIYEFYRNRDPKPTKPPKPTKEEEESLVPQTDKEYQRKYQYRLRTLQSEYGDMNETDRELLRSLARLSVQLEIVDRQVLTLQQSDELDTRNLKNLGDYQRQLVQSMNEIQDKLGINRKQRKEKAADDVMVFVENLKKKSKEFFDRKTVPVKCERDQIELFRYWVNFPDKIELLHVEANCPKCNEKRVYTI